MWIERYHITNPHKKHGRSNTTAPYPVRIDIKMFENISPQTLSITRNMGWHYMIPNNPVNIWSSSFIGFNTNLLIHSRAEVNNLLEFITHLPPHSRDEVIHLLDFTICDTIRDELYNWIYDAGWMIRPDNHRTCISITSSTTDYAK